MQQTNEKKFEEFAQAHTDFMKKSAANFETRAFGEIYIFCFYFILNPLINYAGTQKQKLKPANI